MIRPAIARFFTIALAGIGLAGAAEAGDLTIEILGARSEAGTLSIAVYDSAEGFMKEGHEAAALRVRARGGAKRVTLVGVPAGDYAVAVFHDENGNQKLDTNLVGLPTEGTGFSRDAVGSFGPPKFDAARVAVESTPVLLPIKLNY